MSKIPQQVLEIKKNTPTQKEGVLHVSYSQLSTYGNCPKQWSLQYVDKLAPYVPSIHTVFGTAFHETLQEWLTILYEKSVKESNELDLNALLETNMAETFLEQRVQNDNKSFSSLEELKSFLEDGKAILEFIKKNRKIYFSGKGFHLAGIEALLYQELAPGVFFKGFIDLILYNDITDTWDIIDIKTSTSGWNQYVKSDDKKIAQVLLYKEFFSRQYNIPIDKITVKYFIVKRKIQEDAEYAVMRKRVQEFLPPSGKIKRGQALNMLNTFLKDAISEEGLYVKKDYKSNPSKNNCRFCPFLKTEHCNEGISN